jgi:hypothetical protein
VTLICGGFMGCDVDMWEGSWDVTLICGRVHGM